MKFNVILFLSQSIYWCSSDNDFVAIAIGEIVKNHFVKNSMRFDFIVNMTSDEVLKKVIKYVDHDYAYRIIKLVRNETLYTLYSKDESGSNIKICKLYGSVEDVPTDDYNDFDYENKEEGLATKETKASNNSEKSLKTANENLNKYPTEYPEQSAVHLLDSFEEFWKYQPNHLDYYAGNYFSNPGPMSLNELIVCRKTSAAEIEQAYQQKQKDLNEYYKELNCYVRPMTTDFHMKSFLIESKNGKIILMAIFLFTPNQCGAYKLVKLNQFSKKSLKWRTDKFFATEISNFHGCQLNFEITQKTIGPEDDLHQYDFNDYVLSIIVNLERHLSYSHSIIHYASVTEISDVELKVETYNDYYSQLYLTSPTASGSYIILIPLGEAYSPLEKLFLPFDFTTWMIFLAVFLVAYFTIFIVTFFTNQTTQDFIFGRNVKA